MIAFIFGAIVGAALRAYWPEISNAGTGAWQKFQNRKARDDN